MHDAAPMRKSAWIPWVFVAGMGVVVVANGLLAWFALSTWSGIETEGHYRKGVAYNENLKGAAAQAALGWAVSVSLEAEKASAPGPFVVRVEYRDRAGQPLSGLRVRARLMRPVHEGFDRMAELAEAAPGRYAARIDVPLAGQWDLRLAARDKAGNDHQWLERVRVP